ncbi:hypothetical protein ACFP1I_15645 [Dyadobacter subterraneus]|uniref:Cytochrome c domain-containing protein n=1 Tax=Dyadobacter subterraneus TaxID=2773304 RepID=A0ABR9WI76_9BACT|nr:hypothetical protein [Dyadobacter subterraneus]MBE9465210.1 hypothetical protein [Dyadobacter subterraneus]
MKNSSNQIKLTLIVFFSLGIIFSSFRQETENSINESLKENFLPSNPFVILSDTTKKDPETGLIVDENLYMVKAQCTGCHSTKLIIANHFTRDGWKQKIRWMQANHNLWELGDTEKQVLDYLEKNYAPQQMVSRRAPLKDIKWYDLKLN